MNETISNKIFELEKEIFKKENEGKKIVLAEKYFGEDKICLYAFSVKFLKNDMASPTGIINTLVSINEKDFLEGFNYIVE